jgi:hypothetical protein
MFRLCAADILIIALGVYFGFFLIKVTKDIVEEQDKNLAYYTHQN